MVIGVVSTIGLYLYHRFTSKPTQDKVRNALAAGLEVARSVVATIGPARADEVATAIRASLKIQLAHIGLDPERLPPAVEALMQAAESDAYKYWIDQVFPVPAKKP